MREQSDRQHGGVGWLRWFWAFHNIVLGGLAALVIVYAAAVAWPALALELHRVPSWYVSRLSSDELGGLPILSNVLWFMQLMLVLPSAVLAVLLLAVRSGLTWEQRLYRLGCLAVAWAFQAATFPAVSVALEVWFD